MSQQSQPQVGFSPAPVAVLDRATEVQPQDPGDHDRFAHYVPKREMAEAYVLGTPITALCGKKWVPTRSPEKYPVCPDCEQALSEYPESKPDGE